MRAAVTVYAGVGCDTRLVSASTVASSDSHRKTCGTRSLSRISWDFRLHSAERVLRSRLVGQQTDPAWSGSGVRVVLLTWGVSACDHATSRTNAVGVGRN